MKFKFTMTYTIFYVITNEGVMMRPSLKKNFFYNFFYKIITLLIPLIITPYLSRVLGADGIGIQSYTTTIASYFILIGCLGISSYGAREISRERDNKENTSKIFFELTLLKLFIFSIVICFYIILIIFSVNYSIIFLILLLYLLANILDITWFYTGLEEFKAISIRNIIIKLIYVPVVFLFVRGENALLIYLLVFSIFELASALTLWFPVFKKLCKFNLKTLNLKRHFKNTFIYFIPAIATTITTSIDKVMLKCIVSDTNTVGYYEQAMKVIKLAEGIGFSLNTIMEPRMSLLYKENNLTQLKELLLTSLNLIFIVIFPLILGICAIANNFVPIFFGEGYSAVITLLLIMSPLILFTNISNTLGAQYLTPSGQRKKSAKAIVIGMFINVILNAFLIPFIGSYGAVIASIVAEFMIALLYLIYSRKIIKISEIIKITPKKLFASILMFCLVYGIGFVLPYGNTTSINIVYLLLQIVLGVVFYFLILLLTKDKLVLNTIKNFFSKLKRQKN